MKIHAFAIGMGPALYKKQRGEVLYSLRALPIGGYVMLEGEDTSSDDPRAFRNQSPLKRMIVLLSGAFMNILAGFLLFVLLFSMVPNISTPVIESVVLDSPAAQGGMLSGDKILAIDGKKVHLQSDVVLSLMESKGKAVKVLADRAGEVYETTITPQKSEDGYLLGFYPRRENMTPSMTIKTAFYNTFFVVRLVGFSLKEIITGQVGFSDMAGPVGIVNEMNAVAKSTQPFENLINLMGLIAVNLGVMNLLPIPALDGGRVFFTFIELLRRKPIKPEHEGIVHAIGFALILGLMLCITFSDIQKLFA